MRDILQEGREIAERFHSNEGGGFVNEHRLNAYECDGEMAYADLPAKPGCGAFIVTIDRHPGVTPFMIKCGHCGQRAHSKGYKVQPYLNPTHEWYRPDTLEGVDPAYFDHLSRGGLILRAIPGKPDRWSIPVRAGPCDLPESLLLAKMEADRKIMDDAKSVIISRQVARRAKQKPRIEPPDEIQMYGATYRRVT